MSDNFTVGMSVTWAKPLFVMPIICSYASWERGLNENTNGLIRQYFPKNQDSSTITHEELPFVMDEPNNRPRKRLAMKTPNQVFFGINPMVALQNRIRDNKSR